MPPHPRLRDDSAWLDTHWDWGGVGLSLQRHSKERGEGVGASPLSGWGHPNLGLSLSQAKPGPHRGKGANCKVPFNSEKSARPFSLCCTMPPSHQCWCPSRSGFHLKSQGCYSRPGQCQHHQPSDTDTGLAVSPAHAGVPPNQLLHSRCRKAKSCMETRVWPKFNSNSVSQ